MEVDEVKDGTPSMPLVEKYRPTTLSGVVGQGDVVDTLMKFIDANRVPHMLFYGPPGTGKTTTILACARLIYGSSLQNSVLELNASDDRGINVIRRQIKDFSSTMNIFRKGFKLVILDEADHLTGEAQAALRRIIEKYTRNVRFCLICNYVNKIIPAIQSRCARFRFGPLRRETVEEQLTKISDSENIRISSDAIRSIVKLSEGDLRRCFNLLQSIRMSTDSETEINAQEVYRCSGNPHPQEIEAIIRLCLEEEFSYAVRQLEMLQMNKGVALQDVLRESLPILLGCDFLDEVKAHVLSQLAELEERLSVCSSEKMQRGAFVAVLQQARIVTAEEIPLSEVV